MSRTLLGARAAVICLVVSSIVSCGDPTAPNGCADGGQVLDGHCWVYLDPETEWITEIAATPWGTFVGTSSGELLRLQGDDGWISPGPTAWHGRLTPEALLYVASDPPHLLVGLTPPQDSNDTTGAAVYASYDQGETWTPADGGLAENAPAPWRLRVFVDDLAIDPANSRHLFMSTCHGVLGTEDGGNTWEFSYGSFDICAWFVDVFVDPEADGRVWFASQGNLFNPVVGLTEDWGASWEVALPRCGATYYEAAVSALALSPANPERLFLGTSIGLMQSDDAGRPDSWFCPGGIQGAVAGFARLSGDLYAATVSVSSESGPDGQLVEKSRLGLYLTGDGGMSWDSLTVPGTALGSTVATIDSARGRLLIGTREGVWSVSMPRRTRATQHHHNPLVICSHGVRRWWASAVNSPFGRS
jgi:hypothetical protein